MTTPHRLRRTLSVFLICAIAWLPMASVGGLVCGGDMAQAGMHEHHAGPEKASDQSHQMHLCHSVCASCALLSTSLSALQFAAIHPFNNNIAAHVPRLDLPVQERPPRFI